MSNTIKVGDVIPFRFKRETHQIYIGKIHGNDVWAKTTDGSTTFLIPLSVLIKQQDKNK